MTGGLKVNWQYFTEPTGKRCCFRILLRGSELITIFFIKIHGQIIHLQDSNVQNFSRIPHHHVTRRSGLESHIALELPHFQNFGFDILSVIMKWAGGLINLKHCIPFLHFGKLSSVQCGLVYRLSKIISNLQETGYLTTTSGQVLKTAHYLLDET